MRPTRPVLVSTAVGRHRALQFVGKKIVVPGFVRGCSQMPVTVYRCPIVVFVRNFISKCDNTYAHMYVHEERHTTTMLSIHMVHMHKSHLHPYIP